MKTKLFALLYFLVFYSCNSKKEDIDAISIGYDDQLHYGDLIFTKDSSTLVMVLDTAKAFQKYKRMVSVPETSVVSEEALQYLADFVNKNCNEKIDEVKMRKDIYFTVRTFTNGKIRWCYYYLENDNMLNYFEKMLEYVNKKPEFKEDFKNLIPNLETYIANCKKIKQYGKDDWYNH